MNHTRQLFTLFAILSAISFLTSCTTSNDNYNFKDCEDALKVYQDYHHELKTTDNMTSDELRVSISKWTELSDTVFNFIEKDPAFTAHTHLTNTYMLIHDSIQFDLFRLAVAEQRTLKDVFRIKKGAYIYNKVNDLREQIATAERFYESLDTIKISKSDPHRTLDLYREFLREVEAEGVNNEHELEAFIRQEDVIFRTFLSHLDIMGSESLTDITDKTDLICKHIYKNAYEGKMDSKRVMVMMSMRTNRRLILNAKTCIESMRRQHKLSEVQQSAYFYMMIQPFVAIDSFGMAMLSRAQTKELEDMADTIHNLESTHRLRGAQHKLSDMCNLILKFYIATL